MNQASSTDEPGNSLTFHAEEQPHSAGEKLNRHSGESRKSDQDDRKTEEKSGKPKSRLPLIIAIVVLILAIIGGTLYWLSTRNQESTDDAYTEGNAISIAPKVSGYVVESHINDNSVVKTGDLLLRIDPRDYIAARDEAQANLDAALALLSSAQTDLEITKVRAPANLAQAKAQLTQAEASRNQAERDFARQHAVDPRATTQTTVDQATAAFSTSVASIDSAKAQVTVASLVSQTVRTAEDTVRQRTAQVEQTRARLSQAALNLNYTEIRAPQDGRITRRNVDLGTFAQAGQQVFFIVTNDLWVTANYKETQLDRMRVGQHVDVEVDAYPDLKLAGHIESIQGGSGARFSAFPAENATGNFVKIVRRVPVKILIDRGIENKTPLPIGLSVTPTVALK